MKTAARFCTALRFLTLVPLSYKVREDPENFTKSLVFFPVVGLLIGGVAAAISTLLLQLFPISVVALLSIVFLAFISGCLHLDGLADSADGLFSARPREASLEIMKDSRVGAMGVIAVGVVLLGKYAALSSISAELLPTALLLMPLAGRTVILFTMAFLPYGRAEGGLGKLFYSDSSRKTALIALLLFYLVILTVLPAKAIPATVLVIGCCVIFNGACKAKLGGATGDTLGANCEIGELMMAVSVSCFYF